MVLARDVKYVYTFGNVNVFNYFVDKGYGLPGHDHEVEHTVDVLKGSALVTIGEEKIKLDADSDAKVLPANVWHEVVALEDGTIFNSLFLKDEKY